jgi:hypothetical protein
MTIADFKSMQNSSTPPCCSSSASSSFARHSRSRALHCRHAIDELGAKEYIGIVEHALFERHNNELRVLKMRLEPENRKMWNEGRQ